jgi:hypothetical protein
MKITDVECFRAAGARLPRGPLQLGPRTTSWSRSISGQVGIGESDTNPWVARAMIQAPGPTSWAWA